MNDQDGAVVEAMGVKAWHVCKGRGSNPASYISFFQFILTDLVLQG